MAEARPNFLVIVADDLGFSDCGCFGSEISTPNINALAKEANALRFTNYHVAAACSPTRSMLMTGTDHHIAGLGQLQEITRASPAHYDKPGHEGYLNERVVALPELLSDGGYFTCMTGKWHLGLKPEHWPSQRGFQRSFALLPGCANHYAYEPEYQDPYTEPGKFFETATRALHVEDNRIIPKLPDDFYSSDTYADTMIKYLHGRTEEEKEKPFFAYLPFSAPHWPLQAPSEVCEKYRGWYEDGPEALRQKRIAKLKEIGMVEPHVKAHDVVFVDGNPENWDDLDKETRKSSSRAMEVYAAMVDRMDWNIGRVLEHLKKTGEYDNTFILFMSDNGAEGASFEAEAIVGTSIMEHVHKYYDNSLDNIGRRNSFVWYGCRWAQAATAPSRLYKMHSTEGGCRVPLVVRPPIAKDSSNNTTNANGGTITHAFCTVMDILPTVLGLANLQHPATYQGRTIAPLRGRSWTDFISSITSGKKNGKETSEIHPSTYAVGFEIRGSGAVRRGNWKITFVPAPKGPHRWELFDMKADPGEVNDLSEQFPEVMKEMLALWDEYKIEVGSVGVADEWPEFHQGDPSSTLGDEMEDPYSWIKYIGRPEITPAGIKPLLPVVE